MPCHAVQEQRLVQQLLEREHVPPQQVKSLIRSLTLERMFGNQVSVDRGFGVRGQAGVKQGQSARV